MSAAPTVSARTGLDRFEGAALAAFAVVSVAILAPLLTRGRPLSGADGFYPADQLQYMAWIREAAHHVTIGNRFDLAPGGRPFLHPGFLLSGLVQRVTGVSVPLALLLWKPVAVLLSFWGALAYVRRLLPAGGRRRAALVIALFSVMPASAIVAWTVGGSTQSSYTFDFISGEMWAGQYLWGYLMTAIAVGLMPLVLLAVERHRGEGAMRPLWLAAAGALVVTWLQPWQGATLAVIVVATEAVRYARTRTRPPLRLALVPAAVALPGIYYAVLGWADDSWRLASEANAAGSQPQWQWPWWAIVLTVLPLAAPAILAYRLPARGWQGVAVRVWPLAALVVFLGPGITFPYHAFQGLALPLGVLAVEGVAARWHPRPAIVVAALALLTLPGLAHKLERGASNVHAGADPYFIFPGDHRALDFLEHDPRPGGVLARSYAGFYVPYTTGRETWVGALSWSPHFLLRKGLAEDAVALRVPPARVRAIVRASRARFVYSDCAAHRQLAPALGPLLQSAHHFGCARVYVLRPTPAMARAAGPPDA